MTLVLRYMRLPDIAPVVTIDRLSFDVAWSASAYQFEVAESNYSHMMVLETTHTADQPKSTLERLLRSITGPSSTGSTILGYGGLWNIANESHISTIAVHPQYRGNGYGEVLLAAMLLRSMKLRAAYVILEVRVSNGVAQNLYRKYGFETKAVKERYYQSNGEDAYEMRLMLTPETNERVNRQFTALVQEFSLTDDYTNRQRPTRR